MKSVETKKLVLGQVLTERLEQSGIGVSVASKVISMNKSTLHGWMNGVVPKSLIQLVKLAELLGLSLDELCFGNLLKANKQSLKTCGFTVTIEVEPDSTKKLDRPTSKRTLRDPQ